MKKNVSSLQPTTGRCPALLTAVLSLLLFSTLIGCQNTSTGVSSSETFPDYEIRMLNGDNIRLSQFRGKVVVLDFWAPWCVPCRAETPHLITLTEEYKDKDVVVVGLSIPNEQTKAGMVDQFTHDFKTNYKVGFAPEGMFEKYDCSGVGVIPQTIVLDRNGHKLSQTVGFDPQIDAERLRRAVDVAIHDQ